MNFDIDKTSWHRVQLSDVVVKKEENDRANAQDRFDKFLKVEHMDAGSLHIKRWASQQLGDEINPTFYKIFREGQVLFPTRNPHLKRAALASFDGICGEKTLTLACNENKLSPDFFPFLFHSDSFYTHTISSIVGSTNPHCRWRDVANYEFELPSIDFQKEIAKLLWSIDDVVERDLNILESFKKMLLVELKEIFNRNEKRIPLIELCAEKPKYGSNSKAVKFNNDVRYIRITDIGEFGILNEEKVSSEKHEDKYLLSYGDFLIARSADPGRSYYYKDSDGICSHAGYLIKFKLNLNRLLPEFFYYFTHTIEYKSWITQTTRKGTLSNINSQEFSRLKVPDVSLREQKEAIEKIEDLYLKLDVVKTRLESSKKLRESIINQVF